MKPYHKVLIGVFVIVIIVVSGSLAMVLQSSIQQKTKKLETQEPSPIEGYEISDANRTPPTVTPVSVDTLFGGSPAPTEPPLPENTSDITRETEYLEDLLNEADTDDLTDSSLNLEE